MAALAIATHSSRFLTERLAAAENQDKPKTWFLVLKVASSQAIGFGVGAVCPKIAPSWSRCPQGVPVSV
jgi:hypothetical protein